MNIHEKTPNRRAVPESDFKFRHWRTNQDHCARRLSGKEATDAFCKSFGIVKGGSLPSGNESVGSTPKRESSSRVCEDNCGTAGTPSLSSKSVVGKSKKTTGDEGKMKTVTSAQQKGGVGKTNCVTHIAHDFAERGLKVLVMDLDPQGNATFSLEAHLSNVLASQFFNAEPFEIEVKDDITLVAGDPAILNVEKLELGDVGENLKKHMERVSSHFDVCLIDTAPTLGVRLTSALYVSDFVFTPVEMEAYSMLGVNKMKTVIANIAKLNPKLTSLGLIPSRYDKRNPLQVENYNALKKQLAPVSIGQRVGYSRALHQKKPVWTFKNARVAGKEMRALAEYVYKKMELK